MPKYTITFVKEDGYRKHYQSIIEAEDEQQACGIARLEAKMKGIYVPDEVWTRTHRHKGT